MSQCQIAAPSLSRKNVMNSVTMMPVRNSTAYLPPVRTVPATRDLCWEMYFSRSDESLESLAELRWNGGPASECCTWVAVFCTSSNNTGYWLLIWFASKVIAPAITANARKKTHQVDSSGENPRRRNQAANGCSSAVPSIAAMNGSVISRKKTANLKAT